MTAYHITIVPTTKNVDISELDIPDIIVVQDGFNMNESLYTAIENIDEILSRITELDGVTRIRYYISLTHVV